MKVRDYLAQVNAIYKRGNATEHSYRGELAQLIQAISPAVTVTNEPKRQACGAPDYIVQMKEVPIGYIEAKDVGLNLNDVEKSGQLKRYLVSLDNLILTDYLQFRFYRQGKCTKTITLGAITAGKIKTNPESFDLFLTYINDFCGYRGQTIRSPEELARMMAHKARMIKDVFLAAVSSSNKNNSLREQFDAFKKILINDMTESTFADVYAQTIAYGLFAARLNDPSLDTFTRQEARELIPRTNPFLRNLFDYISGANLDDRVKWIIDDLAEIFRATDLADLLKNFGSSTGQVDPFIHFYETFLAAYDPKLRKSKGVYYTPEPVVDFMVRSVDEILQKEFRISNGLADSRKIKIKVKSEAQSNRSKSGFKTTEKEVHKVQILDPAAGTGTFLARIINQIYSRFSGQEGAWSGYVNEHLLPRIHGFEILMAPYAMCHLKIHKLLKDTGYVPDSGGDTKRLKVFLTNSLEEAHPDTGTLFAGWLSNEAVQANRVKKDTPVMVIIGNPPYSGISFNNGPWIKSLIEDYKYTDGVYFNEKKHWLNDDYVKFIRFAQYYIEKNKEGILAFINPHGFIDNPTFRGMRWNLLKSFDKIYVLDLHGNARKKETAPGGEKDENVFDIMQGVSVNIFIKYGNKRGEGFGQIFHHDVFGIREDKYEFLRNNTVFTVDYHEVSPRREYYFFIPTKSDGIKEYQEGFKIYDLFKLCNTGIVTGIDKLSIFFSEKELRATIESILTSGNPYDEYKIKDTRRTTKEGRLEELRRCYKKGIIPIQYRPFDTRFTLPFENNEYWINSPRNDVMKHFADNVNVGLSVCRQVKTGDEYHHCFITKKIMESSYVSNKTSEITYVFPLYLFKNNTLLDNQIPNLNTAIVEHIARLLGLTYEEEKSGDPEAFAPIDLFDYIYAVLHSPSYRETYKEFLKIDFPRVPYPKDKEQFRALAALGAELRQLHLFEHPEIDNLITEFPAGGDGVVEFVKYDKGKVRINGRQYFDKVPKEAWEFYIGGYQPAQKWLKDRKGRRLSSDEIIHYQKIIVALAKTASLMNQIDKVVMF